MANKPVLIVGGICIVLAIASFGIAGSNWSEGVDEFENTEEMEAFIKGPDNSFTYTYTDVDGQGSGGWYVMMEGEYGDADGNDRTDACENVTFTITDSLGNDVTGEAGHVFCADSNEWRDEWADPVEGDGLIVFGYVCASLDSTDEVSYTCNLGEDYTITSDTQLYVFDKDTYDLQFVEGLLSFIQGGILGFTWRMLLWPWRHFDSRWSLDWRSTEAYGWIHAATTNNATRHGATTRNATTDGANACSTAAIHRWSGYRFK